TVSAANLNVVATTELGGELTLNSAAGTAGQVLTSNGAGNPPSWESVTTPPVIYASRYLANAQAVNIDTLTAFIPDTEIEDDNDLWDTNGYRVDTAGVYTFGCSIATDEGGTEVSLKVNNGGLIGGADNTDTDFPVTSIVGTWRLEVNDLVQCLVYNPLANFEIQPFEFVSIFWIRN